MKPSVRKYLLIFVAWTMYGLMMAFQAHYRAVIYQHRQPPWSRALIAELSYSYLWFALTPGILYLAKRFPLTRQRWMVPVIIHIVAAKICGVITLGNWNFVV